MQFWGAKPKALLGQHSATGQSSWPQLCSVELLSRWDEHCLAPCATESGVESFHVVSQPELTRPSLLPLRMSHVLQFEDKTRKVKDASMQDSDTFEIYDPRNPVNKRRREESKKLLREKKERR